VIYSRSIEESQKAFRRENESRESRLRSNEFLKSIFIAFLLAFVSLDLSEACTKLIMDE
jgi:hypothetical protein